MVIIGQINFCQVILFTFMIGYIHESCFVMPSISEMTKGGLERGDNLLRVTHSERGGTAPPPKQSISGASCHDTGLNTVLIPLNWAIYQEKTTLGEWKFKFRTGSPPLPFFHLENPPLAFCPLLRHTPPSPQKHSSAWRSGFRFLFQESNLELSTPQCPPKHFSPPVC